MWNLSSLYIFISKNYGECKIKFISNEFNTFKMNDLIHVQILIVFKMWKNYIFKYKCEALSYYVCFQYILINVICDIWIMIPISSKWKIQFIQRCW
jgi:hypothetical protein